MRAVVAAELEAATGRGNGAAGRLIKAPGSGSRLGAGGDGGGDGSDSLPESRAGTGSGAMAVGGWALLGWSWAGPV